jgi:hypothetical protein
MVTEGRMLAFEIKSETPEIWMLRKLNLVKSYDQDLTDRGRGVNQIFE